MMKKNLFYLVLLPIFVLTSCVESNNVNKAVNGDNDEGHNSYKQVNVDYESNELNYESTETNYNR
jgi:hypothetical protein